MVKKSFTLFALMLVFSFLCRAQETAFEQLTITDDVCQISTPTDLVNFSLAVNIEGHKDLSAVLTDDIDMDGFSAQFQPIGTEEYSYCGTFNGQFHKISNLAIDKDIDAGFFSIIGDPALIENVIMDNTCTIHCGSTDAGFVARNKRNCGTIIIRNIGMEGTVTIDGWCGAGIFGTNYWYDATIIIENCYMTGDVNNGIEHNSLIIDGAAPQDKVTNCWASGNVNSLSGGTYFAKVEGSSVENCYTVNGDQVAMITEDQIGSGELCFMLNGSSFSQLNWYQTLGVDEHPVTDPTHGVVYYFDGVYHCVTDDISFQEFLLTYVDDFIYTETEHCNELPNEIADRYREALKKLADASTMDEFIELFKAASAIKDSANIISEAYAAFQNKVNEILAVLAADDSFEGDIRDALEYYLTVYEEPSERYPDGTAPYILAQCPLTAEQVMQQIEQLDSWLAEAISEGEGGEVNLVPDEDGFYNISSAKELIWFAQQVNGGSPAINGRLTKDINMIGNSGKFEPIGTEEYSYCGIFDGQFHRISNLAIDRNVDAGFFGIIGGPALIENVIMDKTCTIHCATTDAGFVARNKRNCGAVTIRNIGMEATVTVDGWCGAGIFGTNYWYEATITIENCYMTGDVNNGIEHNSLIIDGAAPQDKVTNCWASGNVNSLWGGTYFAKVDGSNVVNCYSLNGDQVTVVTEEQIKSGELCYLLNGNQSNITWYQTIGVDSHPTFIPTHGKVIKNAAGEYINDDSSVMAVVEDKVDNTIYNIFGQKVQDMNQRGIYIINGKRVLVK